MLFAGALAHQAGASVHLVHIYQVPVSMNEVPVMMVAPDELKNNSDASLSAARAQLTAQFPGLEVGTESRLGDVIDELEQVCRERNPFLVAIGRHSSGAMERFLFGSTTLSLLRELSVPVIAVPPTPATFHLRSMALAIDNSLPETHEHALLHLAGALKMKLQLVHIQTQGEEPKAHRHAIPYHVVKDHDFVHGIEHFIVSNGIDLMAIVRHRHSLTERLFFKTHTKELLQSLSIPVMSLTL